MRPNQVYLMIIGRERIGLVAAITGVLFSNDCNIRDSLMTIMGNQFVMLVAVDLPPSMTVANLEQSMTDLQRRYDLGVYTKRISEEESLTTSTAFTQKWAITIYGGDKKGMIHHVALLLARKGVTITEMKAKVLGEMPGAGIITMKVAAPKEMSKDELREQLQDVATRFGVEVSIG